MKIIKIHVRSMIRAPKGKTLIAFDLSQAESWIVAYLANERNMKHALLYGDIHTETAGSALFFTGTGCGHEWVVKVKGELWNCTRCGADVTKLMRYVGKRYNHASAYRMGPDRAAQIINKDSDKPPYFTVTVKQSRKFSEAWHNYYNLKVWWANIEEQLRRTRTIRTTYGRERTFFAAWGNELFKEATAFEPQSTVGDHFNGKTHPELRIKGGLREIYRTFVKPYDDHKIVNQSHDSAILEVPSTVAKDLIEPITKLMLRPLVINNEEFTIPVDVEWGERWTEMEKAS
jgi:DNA polymerase I-like protein with 3'-5' exonuclease and polymerase domains